MSPYPTDIDDDNIIKHPTHINDVADALKWIDTNIQKYGGNNKKLALIGHSAGAHLVALAGTNQQLFNERDFNFLNIVAVISLDTKAYNVPNTINNVQGNDVYINAFSSELIVQKDASPYYQLDLFNSTVPHWLFVSRGTNFRKEELSKFSTKISKNDAKSKTIDMTGFSHSDVNNLIADKSNPILSSEIRKFLNNSFKP